MEKSSPASAPEAEAPPYEYLPPQGGYPQTGYQGPAYPQGGIPPSTVYPLSGYVSPEGYPPQGNYPQQTASYPIQSPQGYAQVQQSGNQQRAEQQPLPTGQPVYGSVPPTYVTPTYSWWEDMKRNAQQAKSLNAATFIFASGGMSLAWSIGFSPIYEQVTEGNVTHIQICWFLGVIIGAFISAVLTNKIHRRVLNIMASSLVIVNGSLLVSTEKNETDIIIARYCDGIAFGLTIIPTIVAGSENSVKRFRGYVLAIEHLGLIAGMNIFLSISKEKMTQGVLALIYGGLSMAFSFIYTHESPIAYLRKGDETEAINALRRLQRPYILTMETYSLLDENKCLLEEDIARGQTMNIVNGLLPMIKLCVYRAFVAMSLSVPLVWGYILCSILTNPDDSEWRIFIFATMRLIGVLIAVYLVDTVGRKGVSVTSLFIGGGILLGVGSIFKGYSGILDLDPLNTAKGLLIVYQLFAGLAAPASSCYLGEAFSISVKPYFILVAVIFENLIQIIICFAFTGSTEATSGFTYALGGLQLVFGIYFIFGLPETKNITLREALKRFAKPTTAGDSV